LYLARNPWLETTVTSRAFLAFLAFFSAVGAIFA
jgi:hypothetical protein